MAKAKPKKAQTLTVLSAPATPPVSVNGVIEEIIGLGSYTPKYAGEILELLADDSTGAAALNEFNEVTAELSKRHSQLRDSLNQAINELTKLRDSLPCGSRFSKYYESWLSLVNSVHICAKGSFSLAEYTGENLLVELPMLARLGSRESPDHWPVQVACGTDDRMRDYLITKTRKFSHELFSEIAARLLSLIAEDMSVLGLSANKCSSIHELVAEMTIHIEEFAKMVPDKPGKVTADADEEEEEE